MKKIKLNLGTLKIDSFVTDLDVDHVETVKGGRGTFGCSLNGCDYTLSPGLYCSANCPSPTQNGCTDPPPTRGNESICVCI